MAKINQDPITIGDLVDRIYQSAQSNPDILKMPAVVGLKDYSIGGIAYTSVTGISPGFDWDAGKIFVMTDKPVISYDREVIEKTHTKHVRDQYVISKITTGTCPTCDHQIIIDHKYCPECGQKLKWKW